MRKVIYVVLALIVLLVVAVVALPPLIGNSLKPRIADAVRDATGRELVINGDVDLAVFPTVSVALSDVTLSNAPGMSAPHMMSLKSLEAEIPLFPLLGREVIVETLVITEPALFLEKNQDGQPNWELVPAAAEAPPADQGAAGDGAPINELRLVDVRIVGGSLSYVDALSGQEVHARAFDLSAALESLASSLRLEGGVMLNDEAVALMLTLETPEQAMAGAPFALDVGIESPHLLMAYDGQVQGQPLPGLDGRLDVDIASVGALAAWLGQPLDEAQPDPGPLTVAAVFKADEGLVALESAEITGDGLEAKASGSVDMSGEIMKVALKVESGVLDIDRYLPPPDPSQAAQPRRRDDAPKPDEMLAGLPDEPFDLSLLRQAEADIAVSIGGIKAAGFEVGKISLVALLQGGLLNAELSELALYGGTVSGLVGLDGSGDSLGLDVSVTIDEVDVGALAEAATQGPPPVGGVASGKINALANGASPKALVESLKGQVNVDLGGLDLQAEQAAALTALTLAVDLPGLEDAPSLKADMVYNAEPVAVAVDLAPLRQVLSGDPFDLAATVGAKHLDLSYAGKVQQQPVPGLDGQFDLDIASVGQLAAWLGQPLDDAQPDPGPLKVSALFKADGGKVALERAEITGDGLAATANGSFDASGDITKIALNVESGVLDIDRYLPPPAEAAAAQEAPTHQRMHGDPGDMLAGLPDEPIDLTPLRQTEADINVTLGGVKAAGFEFGRLALATVLQGGVLDAELRELSLYGGGVAGRVGLDGSGDALDVTVDVTIDQVDVGALAEAATQGPPPVGGVASGAITAKTSGASPRALAEGLAGSVALDLGGLDLQNEQAAALTGLKLALEMPGLEAAPSLKADLVYNAEPVNVALELAPVQQVLSGEPFALDLKVASALLTMGYAGTVQQTPVPGLDGSFDLDVPSVGKLAAWAGQPLPETQPDPGPLQVSAVFKADEGQVALEQARLDGEGLKAKAAGHFDGQNPLADFNANVEIEELNLNAYLPPPAEADAAAAETDTAAAPADGGAAQQGWSEEPFDLAALRDGNGEVRVTTGPILYRDLTIEQGSFLLTLDAGKLSVTVDTLKMADGQVDAVVNLDAAGEAAAVDYQASINGVQSKPFLETFSGIDWLSGKANFAAKGQARGRNQKEIVETLNGEGRFIFLDGAIEGINLAETLRNAGTLGIGQDGGGETPKTDFTELSGSFTITDGLLNNQDFQMLAPLVRVTGAGDVPLPPQTVDYGLEAKLVASLEGQGGDQALAGLPIPIRITGPWSEPAYDIDWASVFNEAALDPERLKNMPASLTEAAKGFGVDLPIPGVEGVELPGGEGVGKLLEGVTGGATGEDGGEAGGLGEALGSGVQQLLGAEPAEPSAAPAEPAPAAEPEASPESVLPSVEEPLKELKNLFGD